MPDAKALLQRLLTDAAFRASYRRDPAAAARAAGFDELPAGRALETLELRESRQALLGALGAAAVEGVALVELSQHVVPHLGDLLPHVEEAQAATRPSGGDGLLDNDHVVFDAAGIADLKAGRIDPRIVAVLDKVSRDHDIVVSSMRSDHPQLTAGGSVSNHVHGRAVDIARVDGRPVNASNEAARRLAAALGSLDPAMRPDEIGSPWPMPGSAYFTDADHQDHLHVGFDEPMDGKWQPPQEPPPVGEDDVDDDVDDDDDMDYADDVDDEDDGDEDDGDEDDGDEEDGDEDDGDEDEDSNEPPSAGDDDGDEPDEDEPDEEEPDEDEPDEDEPDEDDLTDEGDDSGDSDADEDPDSHDDNSDDGGDSDADEDPDSHDDNSDSGGDSDDDDSEDDEADGEDDLGASGPLDYPGDDAGSSRIAAWMGHAARRRGLPPELPVMAALVESGMTNADHGDADSLGFFQMRTSVWNGGPYAGYARRPELQLRWFLDTAERVARQRRERGLPMDARHYGEWIADVERPAAQYRGRYQLRLEDARELLRALAEDSSGPRALAALSAAERRLGRSGFDGLGLVQWAYRQAGIELPRIDAPGGRPVRRDALLPGDLVLFRNAGGVHHAGISLGGHRFIQAPRNGGAVEVASLREPRYASVFAGGRRFDESVRGTTRDARARVLPVVTP